MSNKLRWGVLSSAAIGLKKVIPAMQHGQYTSVVAIASRDLAKAQQAARAAGIPTAYGSYEELLADPNIDAIYNPLPNQLHVAWTMKAAEAGKHVLCEKPLEHDSRGGRISSRCPLAYRGEDWRSFHGPQLSPMAAGPGIDQPRPHRRTPIGPRLLQLLQH